jgi:hypothetical protein
MSKKRPDNLPAEIPCGCRCAKQSWSTSRRVHRVAPWVNDLANDVDRRAFEYQHRN